ncbi:HlyD family efflux transporter periplasmic adaptor subunit [Shewanella sp. Isolate7]|uniref:efflux RND transporter periplasmic adaptor subunit n=1 Tax=Shewanella sp. Isolate7 TaxID=2908528 RepID=UPI001EFDCE27|nr:HlyD family efflux transporter periplasmic adaptor subunit [Shewanella sp. Isolate7]MCG9720388.1 HlyD family efflux transporter periplasmic adaptor subunit [Shewanella sp. Isolate7]
MFEIPDDRSHSQTFKVVIIVLAIVAILTLLVTLFAEQAFSKSASTPSFATGMVSRSALSVTVSGYGKLVPKTQRGINTISSGHIVEVLQKPGSVVSKGEVILLLNNPKLQRAMETSELALLEEQSNLQLVKAESRQALEDQLGMIRLAKVRLALAQAELTAHEKLKENQVISALDLHKAKVAWEKEDAVLQMESSRLITLKQTRKSIDESAVYRLEKAKKQRELLASEVEQLSITASMDGMLTELADDLEIGRYLDEGLVVGMIADLSSYYARINITASDAEFVTPGLPAKVSIKGVDMPGLVSRVEPTVTNGSVEIDISFTGSLPASVRPNIDVNAVIEVASHQDALVVDRPVGVIRGHRDYSLFVLSEARQQFEIRHVSIGDINGDKAQVVKGLAQDEQILLQVPPHLATRQQFSTGEIDE